MRLSTDDIVFWQHGSVKLNATLAFTWGIMLIMVVGSRVVTRRMTTSLERSRWQNLLELVVTSILRQLEELGLRRPARYLPFIGTLFLFLGVATLATIVPGYEPPTGSLSTTAALALSVFVAVPVFGISGQGFGGYLKTYVEPTFIMLPFH